MTESDKITLTVEDPVYKMPALTTLLYKVCDRDEKKFEEACRLIDLFINAALEKK